MRSIYVAPFAIGLSICVSAQALNRAPSAGPPGGTDTAEHISINDNRQPAGHLAGELLTLRLEARTGQWFPDGDDQPGLVVRAFALEGAGLQIPGPMIRVAEGTTIEAVVRNRLATDLELHGLYARAGSPADAPTIIPAGEVRTLRFPAGRPGTYFYWATSAAHTP